MTHGELLSQGHDPVTATHLQLARREPGALVTPLIPIPRPRARVATGTPTAHEGPKRTARPALALAGGDTVAAPYASASSARAPLGATYFALPPTSACAGTQPGGGAIPITTGRKASAWPLLEGRLPVVTSHPPLQRH